MKLVFKQFLALALLSAPGLSVAAENNSEDATIQKICTDLAQTPTRIPPDTSTTASGAASGSHVLGQ